MSRIASQSFAVNSNLEQKIDIAAVSAGGIPISGTADVNIVSDSAGLATSSNQTSLLSGQSTTNSTLSTISGAVATASNQTTANTSLASIDTEAQAIDASLTSLNAKVSQGYDAQVSSGGSGLQQVLLYGRDSGGNLDALLVDGSGKLEVSSAAGSSNHNGSQANLMSNVSASNGTNSNVITTLSSNNVNIFGNTTGTGGIKVQVSVDNSNFYSVGYNAFPNSAGDFQVSFSGVPSNYWRIQATETATITATLVHS